MALKISFKAEAQTEKNGEGVTHKLTYKIGGIKNANGKKYLWRFVHTKDDGKKIRITVTGKNQGGVSITFAKDKETTVDPEITAEPLDAEGTLIIFDEEVQAE